MSNPPIPTCPSLEKYNVSLYHVGKRSFPSEFILSGKDFGSDHSSLTLKEMNKSNFP